MNNRDRRPWQHWLSIEDLLAASTPAALAESEHLSASPFTMDQPLEVYLERKYLKAVVEISIAQMARHARTTQDPAVRTQLEREVAKREQFVKWLSTQQTPQVYCNVSPAAQWPQPKVVGPEDEEESRGW
jgi:hypothetical protein